MEITLSAPKLGTHPGTTAFVLNYLAKAELALKTTKRRNIGLFIKTPDEEKWDLVCLYCPNPDPAIHYQYESYGNAYWGKYAGENGDYERESLFGPLTPAAWKLVEQFISQCVDALKAAIESDGEGQTFGITIA